MAVSGARVEARPFRLGVYVFEGAEVLDFAGPIGVFCIAGTLDPSLKAVAVGESASPVRIRCGFTVVPARRLEDADALDALLLPGGQTARREMENARLQLFISRLPARTLLATVSTGSLMLEQMGLLPPCASTTHARLVDHGRIIIASGPAAGLELGLHLLRRAGHDEFFVSEVARLMDYTIGYEMYLEDVERHT